MVPATRPHRRKRSRRPRLPVPLLEIVGTDTISRRRPLVGETFGIGKVELFIYQIGAGCGRYRTVRGAGTLGPDFRRDETGFASSLAHADFSRASTVCGERPSTRAISLDAKPSPTAFRQSISPADRLPMPLSFPISARLIDSAPWFTVPGLVTGYGLRLPCPVRRTATAHPPTPSLSGEPSRRAMQKSPAMARGVNGPLKRPRSARSARSPNLYLMGGRSDMHLSY